MILETKKLKPFLDILLTESNFTDEEIRDEVQNFMFAVEYFKYCYKIFFDNTI